MTTAVSSLGQARILVVDDELGPRESLRMLLKTMYQIHTAEGGRSALAEIPRFRPDVVILDIKMPEMDGLEVLRKIKRVDSSIEVVMITAYASLETVKHALTHGAFEYLIKPFSRQDLEDVVRRAVLRRQTDQGARGQVANLVQEMRRLATKTRELEETARREAAEQSLRVTQLSILRELSRMILGQLDVEDVARALSEQLRTALGYDRVTIDVASAVGDEAEEPGTLRCSIREGDQVLGHLVVDNRASGRAIDPLERDLLEMLSDNLAIALRNARLYGEIADTKRSLEQLIACAGDAIISVGPSDRIDGWNPAAERIFGLTRDEALERPITEVLTAAEYNVARQRLAEGTPMHVFETTIGEGQGRAQALSVTLSGLMGRQGELERLIAIVRDITVQREIETQLNQSEKLTALGQLAGGIAHDFNNLLQAILGYSQLMKQNLNDLDFIERSLKIVETAAMDGSETVRRIQQFARLRPDEQFVAVEVNRVVQDALAITRPRWEEKMAHDRRPLGLEKHLGEVPRINGRPAALTEVITNLLLNAMDAMPEGGTLTITTRPDGRDRVAIIVADTGIGMPDAVKRRVFEPFFSTKGEAGSGLGLAMAYSIIKRHAGDIRVEATPGAGATFTLSFPVASQAPTVEATPETPKQRRAARVLVVDDDLQVLSALGELLKSVGHAVTPIASGAAAVDLYKPGDFDVVLTNLGMAGMNGWEVAERLRTADPRVPILFITGWGLRDEDRHRLAALKVHRCLFKPMRPAELDIAIQSALAQSIPTV